MAEAYAVRMIGAGNPHHSNAGKKVCLQCRTCFFSYQKNRKFCSTECYFESKPRPVLKTQASFRFAKPKPEAPKKVITSSVVKCAQCDAEFRKYASQSKKYCSYKCHIDSGGAFRAGLAASEAIMKYGPKKDANHNEIFEELRKYCPIYDISNAGCGVPDGLAWIGGAWHLFDVKNPNTGYGRRGLNPVQKKWIKQWRGGPVYLIYTKEEAARFCTGNFDGIKREESAGTGPSTASDQL